MAHARKSVVFRIARKLLVIVSRSARLAVWTVPSPQSYTLTAVKLRRRRSAKRFSNDAQVRFLSTGSDIVDNSSSPLTLDIDRDTLLGVI